MKLLSLIAFTASISTAALANDSLYERVEIDWEKPSTLDQFVVLMCDDSFLEGADLVISGNLVRDISISIHYGATLNRSLNDSCGVTSRKENVEAAVTTYRIKATDDCVVTIESKKHGKSAKLEFVGGC